MSLFSAFRNFAAEFDDMMEHARTGRVPARRVPRSERPARHRTDPPSGRDGDLHG